jgi:transposase
VLVGIEATGSMHWFLEMMEELGIECRVGHPAKIRKAETRKQKHDRRDARLLLTLLAENRFPTIWMPSTEQRDLRTLLRHRHQWVRLRSRVQHTLPTPRRPDPLPSAAWPQIRCVGKSEEAYCV